MEEWGLDWESWETLNLRYQHPGIPTRPTWRPNQRILYLWEYSYPCPLHVPWDSCPSIPLSSTCIQKAQSPDLSPKHQICVSCCLLDISQPPTSILSQKGHYSCLLMTPSSLVLASQWLEPQPVQGPTSQWERQIHSSHVLVLCICQGPPNLCTVSHVYSLFEWCFADTSSSAKGRKIQYIIQ